MTKWEPNDELALALGALRVHDASPESTARIRARCLAGLRARRRIEEPPRKRLGPWRGWLEPALALGLGVLYIAEAVTRALAAYR